MGMFSAPILGERSDFALLNPPEKPSLTPLVDLKRLLPIEGPLEMASGEANGEEGSAGVGDRANARGGDEESMTIAGRDIAGRPLIAHGGKFGGANAVDEAHRKSNPKRSIYKIAGLWESQGHNNDQSQEVVVQSAVVTKTMDAGVPANHSAKGLPQSRKHVMNPCEAARLRGHPGCSVE